jgi:hypothetical protein
MIMQSNRNKPEESTPKRKVNDTKQKQGKKDASFRNGYMS